MDNRNVVYSDDDDNDEESRKTQLRQKLAVMSFEELAELRQKIGSKVINSALFDKGTVTRHSTTRTSTIYDQDKPLEISSKVKPRKRLMQVKYNKKLARDPRFDDLSGQYDEQRFRERYNFISEIRQEDIKDLKQEMKNCEDEDEKMKTLKALRKLQDVDIREKKREEELEFSYSWKKQQIHRIKEGKKPFFLSRGQLKKRELVTKFEALKNSGKLDKYLVKKRKRNAIKDRKRFESTTEKE